MSNALFRKLIYLQTAIMDIISIWTRSCTWKPTACTQRMRSMLAITTRVMCIWIRLFHSLISTRMFKIAHCVRQQHVLQCSLRSLHIHTTNTSNSSSSSNNFSLNMANSARIFLTSYPIKSMNQTKINKSNRLFHHYHREISCKTIRIIQYLHSKSRTYLQKLFPKHLKMIGKRINSCIILAVRNYNSNRPLTKLKTLILQCSLVVITSIHLSATREDLTIS